MSISIDKKKVFFKNMIIRYLLSFIFILTFSFSFSHEFFEFDGDIRMTLIDHEKGHINVYTYDQVYTLNYSLELLNKKQIIADEHFFEIPFFRMFPFEIDGITYAALNGRSDVFIIEDENITHLASNFDFINHFTGASIFKYDNRIIKYGGYAFWNYFDQFIYYDFDLNSWELVDNSFLENHIPGSTDQILIPLNDDEYLIFSGFTDSTLSPNLDVYSFSFSDRNFKYIGETNFDKFSRQSHKINENNYLLFENLREGEAQYSSSFSELAILNINTKGVYKAKNLPIHQYILSDNSVFFYNTEFHESYPQGDVFLNGQSEIFPNTILFYTKRDGITSLNSYPTIEIIQNLTFDDSLYKKNYPWGWIFQRWPFLSAIVVTFIILEISRRLFYKELKYKLIFFRDKVPNKVESYQLLLSTNGRDYGFKHDGKFYSLSDKCYKILHEISRKGKITNEKLEEIIFEENLSRSTNYRNKSKKLQQLEVKIQTATKNDDEILIQVKSEFDSRFKDYKIKDSIILIK